MSTIPFRRAQDGVYEVTAADLFCGAGGTSTGLVQAVEQLERKYGIKIRLRLVAVNHWPVAIETHSANHHFAQHMCSGLTGVKPRSVIKGPLDLLVASPECTHHSNARGGRPMDDQSRSSGNDVVRWISELMPAMVLIENVREYRTWGPLGKNNKPIKSRKGELFQKFLADIRALGYTTEDRLLCAADYGDPTTRIRLFIFCKRTPGPIAWPEPTHAKDPDQSLMPGLKKWRAAREIIDWSDRGGSIFNRKTPLRPNTMRRIAAGLKKFSGLDLEDYLIKLYGTSSAVSAGDPVPTVTGGGNHLAIIQPFLLGQQSPAAPRSTEDPAPTVAGKGAIAKIEPFLAQYNGTADVRSVDDPAGTLTAKPRFGLAQPFMLMVNHGVDEKSGSNESRARSVEGPLPTVTGANGTAIAQPFMMSAGGPECAPRSTEDPAHTVLTRDHIAVVRPFVVGAGGPARAGEPQPIDKPLGTVLCENNRALVEPFTVALTHGAKDGEDQSSRARSVDAPLQAVTTAHRGEIAVVQVQLIQHTHNVIVQDPQNCLLLTFRDGTKWLLDIFFRMFRPRELARAQGFPDGYAFKGKTEDIVKQIGNAVPVGLATALCRTALTGRSR